LLGLRINAGKHVSIDLGYMHTFYKKRDLTTEVETATGTEFSTTTFKQKSDLFGVGVNLAF
jgi:long-subunit fatty acid transport protein